MTGAVYASDANITFFEGAGLSYPFGSVFIPRIWNGNINYSTGSCPGAIPGPWQVNSAISSLDVDGVLGTPLQGAESTVCVGATPVLNSAAPAGTLTDVAYTFAPHGPALFTTLANQVNIDITHPTLTKLNVGPANTLGILNVQPHPGGFSIPIPTTAPLTASAQQLSVDVGSPDGFTLSQAPQLIVTAGGSAMPPQVDDGFNQINIDQPPYCGTTVDFYGTTYSTFFQNSNGSVTFAAGDVTFIHSAAYWQGAMPRIGIGTDFQPDVNGTITITNAGPALTGVGTNMVISYAGMTEWPTTTGVTSYDIVFHGAMGHGIESFSTDGTWGTTAVVGGATNGGAGTHPGLVSFATQQGLGLQASALATDSVIDENLLGMLPGAFDPVNNPGGWSSVNLPLFDGSVYIVN